MDYSTDHGIIHSNSDLSNRRSSIIFNNKFILAPATILTKILADKSIRKSIYPRLLTYKIIDVWNINNKWPVLRSQEFLIIHEINKKLIRSTARICYIFNCKNFSESIDNILDGFQPTLQATGVIPQRHDTDMSKILFSSFVILQFDDGANFSIKNLSSALTTSFTSNYLKSLDDKHLKFRAINKLDTIACMSTPFANESFFRTINTGTVANIFGRNDCMLVVSTPLVNGCEGGAVYNLNRELIGIVINTTFTWKNENAALSLVARFSEIIREFLEQSMQTLFLIENPTEIKPLMFEKRTVLIQNGYSWGTGTLVQINGVKLVLTCSHVVLNASSIIRCIWINGSFTSNLIFRNPYFNQPYDIALLDVPDGIPDEYFCTCDMIPPKLGNIIYSVGFPHFSSLGTSVFSPSIFEGKITKCDTGMFFTDASVQAGQSGGPIFNENGSLLGVCVSNSKDDKHSWIYPNINMCIPVYEILSILIRYCDTKDVVILNELIANKAIQQVWSLESPTVISKL